MDVWLKRLSDDMESAIAGIGTEQLNWSPAQGRWSVANTLEHLARSFGSTAKAIEEVVGKADKPIVPSPNVKQRTGIFVVTTLGCFPSGRKAPSMVEPTGEDGAIVLRRFRENLTRMDAALAAAAQRWGNILISIHPVLGPLTVHQWRRFHYVHTHHHAKHVRALRQDYASKGKAA